MQAREGGEGGGGSLWLLQVYLYGGARAPNTPAPRPGSGSNSIRLTVRVTAVQCTTR